MTLRTTSFALLLGSVLVPELSAQAGRQAPSSACALVSVAEIRKIMGQRGYSDKASPSQPNDGVAGGGTACRYQADFLAPPPEPPAVSLVLIKGKNFTQRTRSMKLPPGCKREEVKVGDNGFFWYCTSPREYRSPMYVKKGANDLIVDIDINKPGTTSSVRPMLMAVAKAAASKLP
jgi:hypothetical protein